MLGPHIIKELVDALKPFADLNVAGFSPLPDTVICEINDTQITRGQVEDAKRLLSRIGIVHDSIEFNFSELELRMLSGQCKPKYDIHLETASKMFGKPESEITPEARRKAKTVNLLTLYGPQKGGE